MTYERHPQRLVSSGESIPLAFYKDALLKCNRYLNEGFGSKGRILVEKDAVADLQGVGIRVGDDAESVSVLDRQETLTNGPSIHLHPLLRDRY